MKKFYIFLIMMVFGMNTFSNKAYWMWYPGDFEIWLGNEMNNRRTERGAFFPHFWKMDSHFVLVEFSTEVNLAQAEEIEIAVEGRFNIKLDGKLQFGMPDKFILPAGKHKLNIKVWNQATPPALFVNGKSIKSGPDWKVTYEDKEWIDESGKASDTSATQYMEAATSELFTSADKKPSAYKLNVSLLSSVKKEKTQEGELIDFGRETFGYLQIHGLKGEGKIKIYYGESREEALDTLFGETLDQLNISNNQVTDEAMRITETVSGTYTFKNSKAYRYVYIKKDKNIDFDEVDMMFEYKPLQAKGSFTCNDEEINRIWQVGEYTMNLTTREFFIDGVKRDRWTWSGDAIQSYLMNYYLNFDSETVRNTIWLLRGKDPVTSHTNTIMDYTFYWFLSVYDYYQFTGDTRFIRQIYPRMQTMMEYVLGRTNANGMVEGQTGDWIFVDWAEGYMSKKGELSFEQVLFARSLETMALCADLNKNEGDKIKYSQFAKALRDKIEPAFWDETRKALVHSRFNGKQQEQITRYANMFAVFFDYLSPEKKDLIKKSVLLNDSIMKITTPYMRFYELEALCALGEHQTVTREMKAYWGGMLREGATTFWEKYNPDDQGTKHLAMYGRPYGKSLCHAWGASPIYLLGKYYLGIQPVEAGYSEFKVAPVLGGLQWMEGSVPTPQGEIKLYMNKNTIKVKASSGKGYLYFSSKSTPKSNLGQIETISKNKYRLRLEGTEEFVVRYN